MTPETETETPHNEELRADIAEAAAAAPVDDGGTVARLQAEIETLRSQALYAQADTQNVRRRLEKEKADASAYAATGFARDMLSIADNLARALAAIPDAMKSDEAMKPLVTGLEATGRELDSVFTRHGIVKVESVGQTLDPHRHQAMIEMPSDQPAGTIVQEMQAGYMMKDRLLRPALVGVARPA